MAKDYKRIGEGDTGLNTGGMGAVSPVPFVNGEILESVVNDIVEPTFKGFEKRGQKFVGFLFFGLIQSDKGPKVIEYNVRMGDPETEVVFPRLKNDMVELLYAMKSGLLHEVDLIFDSNFCTTVFAVSGGYPEAYEKNKEIKVGNTDDGLIFHAGTKRVDGKLMTSGGRVLASTGMGSTMGEALRMSYENMSKIQFDGKYYRRDIGKDLLELQDGNSQ